MSIPLSRIYFTTPIVSRELLHFAKALRTRCYRHEFLMHFTSADELRVFSDGSSMVTEPRQLQSLIRLYNHETGLVMQASFMQTTPEAFRDLLRTLDAQMRDYLHNHNDGRVTATDVLLGTEARFIDSEIYWLSRRHHMFNRPREPEVAIRSRNDTYTQQWQTEYVQEQRALRPSALDEQIRFIDAQLRDNPDLIRPNIATADLNFADQEQRAYMDELPDLGTEISNMFDSLHGQPSRNINQGDHMSDAVSYASQAPDPAIPPWIQDPQPAGGPAPVNLQELTMTLDQFASHPTPVILLAELMEQKYLVSKSKESDTNFLNEQQQCLEVILQLTEAYGHQNFQINKFIQPVSKSSSRRLISSTDQISDVISIFLSEKSKLEQVAKAQVIKDKAFDVLDSIYKEKRVIIPVISPITNLRVQITNLEMNITKSAEELRKAQQKVSDLTVRSNGWAKELGDMYKYIRSITGESQANQMDDVFAFFHRADGKQFPFEYMGIRPDQSGNNYLQVLFRRAKQTIKDKDSELEWIVPEMFITMILQENSGIWTYYFKAGPSRLYTMKSVHPIGDSGYMRHHSYLSHPHVNSDDHICRGNAASMLDNMSADLTLIEDSLLVLDSLLRTYNPGSPYQSAPNFLKECPKMLYNIAHLKNQYSCPFVQNLRDRVKVGEMSLTESIDQMFDKYHDIMKHRFMCHLIDEGLPHDYENLLEFPVENYPTVSSLSDHHGNESPNYSYKIACSEHRPFGPTVGSDMEQRFLSSGGTFTGIYSLMVAFDDFYTRFYVPRNENGGVVIRFAIFEALTVFMEEVKRTYRLQVENRIENYENSLALGYEIGFDPSAFRINEQNFDLWFTQTRKN